MTIQKLEHDNGKVTEWQWASDNDFIKNKKFTSSYLIDGILIDTTAPAGLFEFKKYIESFIHKEPIKYCLLTHYHEDHSGAAHILDEDYSIPIYISKKSTSIMEKGLTYLKYRQIYWGEDGIKSTNVRSYEDNNSTFISNSGEFRFSTVDLPGHCYDLKGIIEENHEYLFVADAIMPKYQMLFGKTCDFHENIEEIYNSILKIIEISEKMNDPKIFVAHDKVRGIDFILSKKQEIEDLHNKAHLIYKKLVDQGITKDKKIMRIMLKEMFGGESFLAPFTHGELSKENLVISLLNWSL